MSTDIAQCPVCNQRHPVREGRGITHADCRAVPDGWAWVNRVYKTGPNGALIETGKAAG